MLSKLSKFIALGICGLLSAGCATQAQQRAASISAQAKAAAQGYTLCLAGVLASPPVALIGSRAALKDPSQPSLPQLADTSYATNEQIAAIFAAEDAWQPCKTAVVSAFSRFAPGMANIFVQTYQSADQNAVALVQKKITWGEFNKLNEDAFIKLRTALTAEGQRIDAGLQQENAQEAAQRQQAIQAYLNYMHNQGVANAANRPVTTNCMRVGTMVSCTTN